jgi:hypothetical protein
LFPATITQRCCGCLFVYLVLFFKEEEEEEEAILVVVDDDVVAKENMTTMMMIRVYVCVCVSVSVRVFIWRRYNGEIDTFSPHKQLLLKLRAFVSVCQRASDLDTKARWK